MPNDRVIQLLESAFQADPGSLTPASNINDQWESIALLGFMAAVDEEFGVVLSPQKLMACQTAGDVAKLVEESAG